MSPNLYFSPLISIPVCGLLFFCGANQRGAMPGINLSAQFWQISNLQYTLSDLQPES
jgi:hypothetical protein